MAGGERVRKFPMNEKWRGPLTFTETCILGATLNNMHYDQLLTPMVRVSQELDA